MGVGSARGCFERGLIGVRAGETEVFPNSCVEEIRVLTHQRKQGPQLPQGHVTGINLSDTQAPLLGIEGTQEQVEDRRLASSRRPDQGYSLSRSHIKIELA